MHNYLFASRLVYSVLSILSTIYLCFKIFAQANFGRVDYILDSFCNYYSLSRAHSMNKLKLKSILEYAK